ncbi:MAG: hypothetical protein R3E32_16710 [Chitinophagales bacterium]
MDAILINALIGGIFSILGIFIKHRLDKKNEITPTSNVEDRDAAQFDSKKLSDKFFNKDLNRGLSVLFLDLIAIIMVVAIFDLNNTEPFWEDFFAMVVLGAIPVYAVYYLLKGFFRYFVH